MSGQLSKDEVAKLLERITVSDTKSGNREITPRESASTQLKTTGTKKAQSIEKCPVKKKLCQFPSVIEAWNSKYQILNVHSIYQLVRITNHGPVMIVVLWSKPIYLGIDFRFYLPMVDTKASTQSHGNVNWCTRTRKVIKKITFENKLTKIHWKGGLDPTQHILLPLQWGHTDGKDNKDRG